MTRSNVRNTLLLPHNRKIVGEFVINLGECGVLSFDHMEMHADVLTSTPLINRCGRESHSYALKWHKVASDAWQCLLIRVACVRNVERQSDAKHWKWKSSLIADRNKCPDIDVPYTQNAIWIFTLGISPTAFRLSHLIPTQHIILDMYVRCQHVTFGKF